MTKEYLNYIGVACKEGMKPEEVQNLFNDIYSKSNTKQGKRVLRLFAKGIGNAKKKNLIRQQQIQQQQLEQQNIQFQNTQQKGYQYVYKQN